MIILFISAVFSGVVFSFFGLSLNLTSINRIVIHTPKQIFETSIPYVGIGVEVHFDKALLKSKLQTYYDANILQYTDSYSLDISYYNSLDESACISSYCQSVNVKVSTSFLGLINYSRTMFYEITKGALYAD